MASIQTIHQNMAGLTGTVNRNSRTQVTHENKGYDSRGSKMSSRSFQSMLEKPDNSMSMQGDGVIENPPDKHVMSRLTDLLQQLFQLLQKLQGSQLQPENKPATEPNPPVVEPKPPVTEPKPPVTEPKPPVTEPNPPVAEPKPPVAEPKPPVTEPKPPVAEPKPPVAEPKPPVTEPQPPLTETKPPQTNNKLLKLTTEQRKAIGDQINRTYDDSQAPTFINRTSHTFTGEVIDNDGDGEISIGDTASQKVVNEFKNLTVDEIIRTESIRDHVLSLEDFETLTTEQDRLVEELTSYDTNDPKDLVKGRLRIAIPSNVLNETGKVNIIINTNDESYVSDVIEETGDNKISVGDSVTIKRNGGDTVQHSLTQDDYDRFISGSPYIDPALDNIGNSHFDDLQKNKISGFLDEARRYGEVSVWLTLEEPDDYPVAPPFPHTREEGKAYTESLKQAGKEVVDAALQRLTDAGLAIDPENVRGFLFGTSVILTVTEAQLVAISSDTQVTSIDNTRHAAVGHA